MSQLTFVGVQLTMFGVTPLTPHYYLKPEPAKESEPAKSRPKDLNRYESLGLDTTKRSEDKGQLVRAFYCSWDKVEVERGFSLCFQHFVLSEKAAIRLQSEPGTPNSEKIRCDHCRQITETIHITECEWFALCPECVSIAVNYLTKPRPIKPGTQFSLL